MTRRERTADTDEPIDAGDGGEGRFRSAAAAMRASKKISAVPVKASRRNNDPEQLGEPELRQRLEAAEARVKELEARLATVSDRIAWVIDRLHSLMESNR